MQAKWTWTGQPKMRSMFNVSKWINNKLNTRNKERKEKIPQKNKQKLQTNNCNKQWNKQTNTTYKNKQNTQTIKHNKQTSKLKINSTNKQRHVGGTCVANNSTQLCSHVWVNTSPKTSLFYYFYYFTCLKAASSLHILVQVGLLLQGAFRVLFERSKYPEPIFFRLNSI